MSSEERYPRPRERELVERLSKAQEFAAALQQELEATNRGLIALALELDEQAEELRQAEERYRSIFENAVEGIYQLSPEGRFIVANPAIARILGYESPDELIVAIDDVHRQLYIDPDEHRAFLRQVDENGVNVGVELRVRREDGSVIWVAEHTRALIGPMGQCVGYEGAMEDVTARKRAERELEESEQRYRSLFEHNPDAVFSLDLEGRVVSANAACERVAGYSVAELLGSHVGDFVPAEERPRVAEHMERLRRGEPQRYEATLLSKSGARVELDVNGLPIVIDGEIVGVFGLGKDVTERKHLQAQFQQAQKMEAVGRLAGGVAHDFNNVLTVIQGHTELLLLDRGAADPKRQNLIEIRDAAARAATLTRQLLTFSRKEVAQPQTLDVNEIVSNSERMLRRLIGEHIELVTSQGESLGHVRADPGQLEQVLMNLVINSRDAMPDGGRLVIETANFTVASDQEARALDVDLGSYVRLKVSDTGHGMDQATREHIFEPFFTTKEKDKGTGLGLSMAYGCITQADGNIRVESQPGHGTTFEIYLPHHGGHS